MKSWIGVACAGVMALTSSTDAFAGGFTPWGTGTGANTIALSPYFFVGPDGTMTLAPYVFFGAHDLFDVMVGYAFSVDPKPDEGVSAFSGGAIELMPRITIRDEVVIAVHALYAPGDDAAVLGLELHGVTGSDYVGFTYNAGWWPSIGGDAGFDSGDVFGILVPEFFVNERFSVFTEFNPAVNIASGEFSAKVVPGLTYYVDKDLKHSLTVAATMAVAPTWEGATFGLLYWTDFGLKKSAGDTARRQHHDAGSLASLSR